MTGLVMLEDFSERHYREPVATPCEVLSQARHAHARSEGHRHDYGLVTVLVEGESEPRDVSACRVIVDGAALWPRRA